MPTVTIQYVCVATNPINYNCLTPHGQAVVVYEYRVCGVYQFTTKPACTLMPACAKYHGQQAVPSW